jgi:hypothetical protein
MVLILQGDQKVSVHLMITIQSSDAQRHFDHLVLLLALRTQFFKSIYS